jgi:hypothetical protein
VIRVFEDTPREIVQSATVNCLEGERIDVIILFPRILDKNVRKTVEPWLSWEGSAELRLTDFPMIC